MAYRLSGSLPEQEVTFRRPSWFHANPYRGENATGDHYLDMEDGYAHVKTYADGTTEFYFHPDQS